MAKEETRKRNPSETSQHEDDSGRQSRKIQEKCQESRETSNKSRTPNPPFIPYGTMFKLETRSRNDGGRMLECVNCGSLLEWRIYTVAPEKLDAECPSCGLKAVDFWNRKLHREIGVDG